MKKQLVSALLFCSLGILIFSCNTNTNEKQETSNSTEETELYTQDQLWTVIKTYEKKVENSSNESTNQAGNALIAFYKDYARRYPEDDDKVKHCLFESGRLSINLNQPLQALEMFKQFRRDYAHDSLASTCLFLTAFTYEKMNKLGKAKTNYEEFVKEYPNNELAKDAKLSIKNLGKSPEELVKEFEAKDKSE